MIFKKQFLLTIFYSLLLMTPLRSSENQNTKLNQTRQWLTGRNLGWTALALGAVATVGGFIKNG